MNWKSKCKNCGGFFDIDQKKLQLKALEKDLSDSKNWADHSKMAGLNKEKTVLCQVIEEWTSLKNKIEENKDFLNIVIEEKDENCFLDLKKESKNLSSLVSQLEVQSFLSGEHDRRPAYLTIHSGAGGTEAQDWSFILQRMYLKWAEQKGFRSEVISFLEGETAGVKSVTLLIDGVYAYGFLKGESGVHRLVRISPFDSNSRRHTSFSSVFVWPEVTEAVDIQINEEDLRIDTYRASGAGGQHVNKTDSAVRITHIPTGQVVQCQNQRSQHANRTQAMKMLESVLYKLEQEKREQEKKEKESLKKANEWGSQIRSYILHPYQMVKDHRTGVENSQPQNVLNGDLESFISAYLLKRDECLHSG